MLHVPQPTNSRPDPSQPTASQPKRRLLLASDHPQRSRDLLALLQGIGEVSCVSTADLPLKPVGLTGIIVDIDLRQPDSVQRVRRRLLDAGYQTLPRLFVLADALHHGTMQAWALGATDTIVRPFDARSLQQRIRAAFPDAVPEEASRTRLLSAGVAAAHAVMSKIFDRMPRGMPLSFEDVMKAEGAILKAIKQSSLREWLALVGRHHNHSYRHCLFVTGFAVAFAQHLNLRDEDQRRLTRAALLHDVGKAFVPLEILDYPGKLDAAMLAEIRQHPRRGHDVLAKQGGFPPEVLDVVLHHHEMLDGSGYPEALAGPDISDIVRIITITDIYAALVEKRSYRPAYPPAKAFKIMEEMGDKLDTALLQAFRPVALGL